MALLASLLAAALAAGCPKGCSLHGTCEASGACKCFPGFVGDDCATPILCPNNCSQHGKSRHGLASRRLPSLRQSSIPQTRDANAIVS